MRTEMKATIFFLGGIFFLSHASYAKVWRVGPSQNFKFPSAVMPLVSDGDTVDINAGLYSGDVGTWTKNDLVIRGIGGYAHLDAAGKNAGGKGIWVITGVNTYIENMEFSGCTVPDKNGAGIRQEGDNLELRHCYFHDNEDGVLTGASETSDILFEACEFARNGYGDGYSHNIYIGNIRTFSMRFCYSHHAKAGHCVKSRAQNNFIEYNRIMDEDTGSASYLINLPNGGYSAIVGNTMMKGLKAQNKTLIDYGSEGFSNSSKYLIVINNTMVSFRNDSRFVTVALGVDRAHIYNNIFVGNGRTASGLVDTERNIFSSDLHALAFIDSASFDYRPKKNLGNGIFPETINNKPSLAPSWEYRHPTDSAERQYASYPFPTYGAFEPLNNTVTSDITENKVISNFPNPFSERTTMNLNEINDGAHITMNIYNPLGGKIIVKEFTVEHSQIIFERGDLPSGMYYYEIVNTKGDRISFGKIAIR